MGGRKGGSEGGREGGIEGWSKVGGREEERKVVGSIVEGWKESMCPRNSLFPRPLQAFRHLQ